MLFSMGRILICKNLLISISQLIFLSALAQGSWEKEKEYIFEKELLLTKLDLFGKLYVSHNDGTISTISLNDGKIKYQYDFGFNFLVTKISVQNNLSPLFLDSIRQEVKIFDRFLADPQSYLLTRFTSKYVWDVTFSSDGQLWILEGNPQILNKINIDIGQPMHKISLDGFNKPYKIESLANLLLLKCANQNYIIDQLGNIIFTIPKQAKFIRSTGNEFFFVIDRQLKSSNGTIIDLPILPHELLSIYHNSTTLFLISHKKLEIFKLN